MVFRNCLIILSVDRRTLAYQYGGIKMSYEMLQHYMKLCKEYGQTPTWEGLSKFKELFK